MVLHKSSPSLALPITARNHRNPATVTYAVHKGPPHLLTWAGDARGGGAIQQVLCGMKGGAGFCNSPPLCLQAAWSLLLPPPGTLQMQHQPRHSQATFLMIHKLLERTRSHNHCESGWFRGPPAWALRETYCGNSVRHFGSKKGLT